MPAYSIASPSSATPSGATSSASQKLPTAFAAETSRYAPTANSAPWAKFGMLRIPVISDRPSPIRAYSMPVAIPLRIWARRRLRAAGSEAADVLAGRVFLRQRRVAGGDHVGEVERILHLCLGLAAQEEVRPQRLVRGGVDAHAPEQVVHLDAFERLDDVLHLGGLRLVEAGEHEARHRVRGRGRVAGGRAEFRAVVLHELLGDRRIRGVVEVGADPEVLADLGVELDQLFHARGPAHDQRHLGRQAEVVDLARARHRVAAEVDHRYRVGAVGRGLLHVVGELALAQRVAVGADEFQAVVLADFLDVLLQRPAEGVVGDQQVPALGLGVGLHEVVHHGLRGGVGARGPLEGVAVAAAARDVLGPTAEEMQHLLALGDFRHGERHARGPRPDHEARAFAVNRLLGATGGGARLRAAVARDVLDRPAEDLHAALLERHAHAAVVERADIGEGAGLVPQAEDHDLLVLRAHDAGKAQPARGTGGGDAAELEDVPALDLAHDVTPWSGSYSLHLDLRRREAVPQAAALRQRPRNNPATRATFAGYRACLASTDESNTERRAP